MALVIEFTVAQVCLVLEICDGTAAGSTNIVLTNKLLGG
jgi:hypothetical protein